MMAAGSGKRVLVMIPHPDDAEVHAGGTVARWVDEGHKGRIFPLDPPLKGRVQSLLAKGGDQHELRNRRMRVRRAPPDPGQARDSLGGSPGAI